MASAPPKKRRPALGMGIDALLPDSLEGEFFLCPVEDVRPSPHQPRQHFHDESIEELAQSIRGKGLIQPIILRRAAAGGYELIAGERRWRASQRAGLTEIPAILREADDEDVLELALIENLQREDLDPVEEAEAFRVLIERIGLTQEQLATRIGKSRAAVANALRLLTLFDDALDALRQGVISAGHARAILAVDGEEARRALLAEIRRRGLSVRQAEALAAGASQRSRPPAPKDPDVKSLEGRLSRMLGTRVVVQRGRRKGAGRLTIEFRSLSDLDRILELIEH